MSKVEEQQYVRQQLELLLQRSPDAAGTAGTTKQWNSFPVGICVAALIVGAVNASQPLLSSTLSISNAFVVPPPVQVVPSVVMPPVTPLPELPNPLPSIAANRYLSAARSVVTGVVDPSTLTASYYWTIVLHNSGKQAQEARMHLKLPRNAAVTRATLWIDGRAQEAAFQSQDLVRDAYEWIVERHRDPLLVTQIAPDVVSLQASPVMPHKDMQIRIGITVPMILNEQNKATMELPQVVASNVSFTAAQNIHLTSPGAMKAQGADASCVESKSGYVLRANLNSESLKKLSITCDRTSTSNQFATRATHSNPRAWIVATVAAAGPDRSLTLKKVTNTPDCPIIDDNDAAFRLSNIWAHNEIEALVKNGISSQAVELASIYRVVSTVSGAVVLERADDYTYNGLERNLYRSTSYVSPLADKQAAAVVPPPMPHLAPHMSRMPQPVPTATPVPASRLQPIQDMALRRAAPQFSKAAAGPVALQGATNGTIGPQGNDASVERTRMLSVLGPGASDMVIAGAQADAQSPTTNAERILTVLQALGIIASCIAAILILLKACGLALSCRLSARAMCLRIAGASLLLWIGWSLPSFGSWASAIIAAIH